MPPSMLRCPTPHCKSLDFTSDPQTGDTYCTWCGAVTEENAITSEVTFTENAGGGMSMEGSFVARGGGVALMGAGGRRVGGGGGGGEGTIRNASTRIRDIANLLTGLHDVHVSAGIEVYKIALDEGQTKGRSAEHIAAACLYIACRQQGTPHMLIDFSDAMKTDLYELGKIFLALKQCLRLKSLTVIDPAIYMERYAHGLKFPKKKLHGIAKLANRVAKNMTRNWITQGRHPQAICGACLYIAGRLKGEPRDIEKIAQIVKTTEHTIGKRLKEYSETRSAELSLQEFDDETILSSLPESFPPSFAQESNNKSKRKSKQVKEIEELVKGKVFDELGLDTGQDHNGYAEGEDSGDEHESKRLKLAPGQEYPEGESDDEEVRLAVNINEAEIAQRERLFDELHGAAHEEAEKKYQEKLVAIAQAVDMPKKKKRANFVFSNENDNVAPATTFESVSAALANRTSKKINIGALGFLFPDTNITMTHDTIESEEVSSGPLGGDSKSIFEADSGLFKGKIEESYDNLESLGITEAINDATGLDLGDDAFGTTDDVNNASEEEEDDAEKGGFKIESDDEQEF